MIVGFKKGDILHPFDTRLAEMQTQAGAQAAATCGEGVRKWNIPEDANIQSLLTIPALHGTQPNTGYDRTELNTRYEQCFQDPAAPGTNGDIAGLKTQIDWLAANERAFRFRHATTPRLLILAASRRYFVATGPAVPAIKDSVDKVIRAGALG